MRRKTATALGLVCAALAAVAFGALRLFDADNERLHQRFAAERQVQVEETAELSRRDLDGVAVLLHLAGNLLHGAEQPEVRQRELEALMAASDQFRALRVFGPNGETVLSALNPRLGRADDRELENEMRLGSLRSLSRAGELDLSQPILIEGGRTLRIYALSLKEGIDGRPGAIAVLVDSERLLSKISVLASEPAVRVLLLGPHGQPTPSSDPRLAAAASAPDTLRQPGFTTLLTSMRSGRRATQWLNATEATSLGLGDAEVVAAFAPLETERLGQWSLAIVTSTSVLRAAQQSVAQRLGTAAGAIAVLLIVFGGFVVLSARRAAVATERLVHAERLARFHERTEKTLDNIPAGVLRLSADQRVTSANRWVRQRLGDAAAFPCALSEALPGAPDSTVVRLEGLVEAADGARAVQSLHGERLSLFGVEGQYSVHAVPLGPGDDEARSLLVIDDVSEVRALESQLLRAEKLATIGVLAAGLAHEVGTPLGIVRSRAELVLEKLGHEHAQARGLTIVIEQIDRVTRTIRQMLDFSRVQPASVRPVALTPVAIWLNDVLHYEALRRKLTFEINVPPSLPAIAADPDQLQQVLLNLVMNACDACSDGGHVTFKASPSVGAAGWHCVRLDIADNGCGIPEAQRQGIFDPFFTTKKRGQGTGLGLTVAAQIVRNHGATLELSSEEGRGTTVLVFWPLAVPPITESEA